MTDKDPIRAALETLYEWYDRDGSVGGAGDVFERHRKVLSAPKALPADGAGRRQECVS